MIKTILTVAFCAMFGSYLAVNMHWIDDFSVSSRENLKSSLKTHAKVEKELTFTERVTQKAHKGSQL